MSQCLPIFENKARIIQNSLFVIHINYTLSSKFSFCNRYVKTSTTVNHLSHNAASCMHLYMHISNIHTVCIYNDATIRVVHYFVGCYHIYLFTKNITYAS